MTGEREYKEGLLKGCDVVRLRQSTYECAGKQSSAGGGDGCILFAPNTETRAELMKGLEARGFLSMTLDVESGLRGEAQADPRLRAWLDAHA